MSHERRTVLMLAASQALFMTAVVLIMTIGGLAGQTIAPSKALATLPIAFVSLGTAIVTIPASLLMGRIGRKAGFLIGAGLGVLGGAVAAVAMVSGNFALLCLGTALVGGYQGFAQFYRFAAAEASSVDFKSRAISYVMAGGIVAAIAGPQLGALTKDAFAASAYAGSFLVIIGLSLVAAAVLWLTPLTTVATSLAADSAPARPLPQILGQPKAIAAITTAAVGAGVMVMVMTATPLSMVGHGHAVASAAFVIQWHVLGMYVPSFFTGSLIKRFGVLQMMALGLVVLCVHLAIALSGMEMLNFISALVLLGIGWNLLYVGGSTLLTETYHPSERAKVQALNDFLIVGVAAVGSFSSGWLVDQFGWRGVNLAAIPLMALAALAIAYAVRRPQPSGVAA